MQELIKQLSSRLFKKFKPYSAAEIIAAGGTTAFGKLTNIDPKNLYTLEGEPLTGEELEATFKRSRT